MQDHIRDALAELEAYANDMTARCRSAAEGSRTDGDREFARKMDAQADAYSDMTMRLREQLAHVQRTLTANSRDTGGTSHD